MPGKKPELRDYLMKQHGAKQVASKPNPAYAGLPPDIRAVMERQDREGLMAKAAAAQGKGTVSGGNVQAGQRSKAEAEGRAEAARKRARASEDEGLKGMGRGLKGRRAAIDKLSGR